MPNDALAGECRVFARYLSGLEPARYIIQKYLECHAILPELTAAAAFDDLLVRMASMGPAAARFADAYAARFRKHGTLRKKLVLVLALLECAPPHFERLDEPGARTWALPRLAWTVAVSSLMLVASAAVLLPLGLVMRGEKSR